MPELQIILTAIQDMKDSHNKCMESLNKEFAAKLGAVNENVIELKFAKWCLEHIIYLSDCTYAHGNFEFPEVKKTYFDTIDEIYKYWLENVKINDTK